MPYVYIIAAASIFAAGFGLSHQLDKAEIQALQAAIERGNSEALHRLELSERKLLDANHQADLLNQQLEASHAQSIETINAYRSDLDNRLYERSTRRRNTVPACPGAGNTEAEAASTDLSERAIADLAARADQVATYAQACWQFVNNDCGIKP